MNPYLLQLLALGFGQAVLTVVMTVVVFGSRRLYSDAYSVSPAGVFVAPGSSAREAQGLGQSADLGRLTGRSP